MKVETLPPLPPTTVPRVFVLAIGNNSKDLRYAEKDAYDFVAAVQKNRQNRPVYAISLTGPSSGIPSIRAAFQWLASSTRSQDETYILWSGHGAVDFTTQRFYYLSYDPKNEVKKERMMSDQSIATLVSKLSGNIKMFIDSCASGNFNDYLFNHVPAIKANSLQSFVSTKPWASSYEDWGNKNGYFTLAILGGINQHKDRNYDEMSRYLLSTAPVISFGTQIPDSILCTH